MLSHWMLSTVSLIGFLGAAVAGGVDDKPKSCCEQQLKCCKPQSACCVADVRLGCCEKGLKCCTEKRACCTGVQKCCQTGSACCDAMKACCGDAVKGTARLDATTTEPFALASCCAAKKAADGIAVAEVPGAVKAIGCAHCATK